MLDTIIGLSPNKEEHQTTIDVEPVGTRVVTKGSYCLLLITFVVETIIPIIFYWYIIF